MRDDLDELDHLGDLGDLDDRAVAGLGTRLWRRYGSEPNPPWQYRSAFDQVIRRLALRPGPVTEAAEFLITVADGGRARYVASLLASEHTASEMRALTGHPELRACLAHELVLRALPPGRFWAPAPHPLSWLPLSVRPVERWPKLHRYSMRNTSVSHLQVAWSPVPPWPGSLPSWRETPAGDAGAAVADFRVEARTVVFDAPVTPHALTGLDMASTRGLTEGFGVCSFAAAWHQLFGTASTGGAYQGGSFGAYGRLVAWRSVAALAGAPPGAGFDEVYELAESCTWIWFGGATEWFEGDGWDLGLAALSAGGRRLAVLAATDTD